MKHKTIFALFFPVFIFFSQPVLAATVFNRVPSGHSVHHNNHSHHAAEVRKCKPPEEDDGVLNGSRSSRMVLAGGRRNIQAGKSSAIFYEKPAIRLAFYPCITLNNIPHLEVLSMLILFPFHAFW